VAIPVALLFLPILFAAAARRRRNGAALVTVGPWVDVGGPPEPIATGPLSNPTIQQLLAEMDDYFVRSFGIDTSVITAREVTRETSWARQAIPPREYWPRMGSTIRQIFMPLRQAMGVPITVRSGYRSPEYNAQAGGEEDSRHMYFEALDLSVPSDRNRLALVGADFWLRNGDRLRMGFGAYGAPNSTNIHCDAGFKKRSWAEADYWVERAKQVA
jgi:hypothetical protein